MWITYALFILGFALLIKGADYLVEGASAVALRFGWSPLFIGLTIVAFGTSAPELFVNVSASLSGAEDLAVGNILGSNISNILLILGTAALITPLTVKTTTISREIPLSLLAVVVLGIVVNDRVLNAGTENILSRGDGLVLIAFFTIFMYYAASIRSAEAQELPVHKHRPWLSALMIIGGLAGLTLGGQWIVEGGRAIAVALGLSEALVGLTVVAVGTSLPELAASGVAAYKGKTDLAIGNVIGSNIFNIFWVLAVSSVISPITFSARLNFDIATVVLVTLVLLGALYAGKRRVLQRWEGYVFVMGYVAYIAFLVYRG